MANGLYSGTSGFAIGAGLYASAAGLWGNSAGLIDGFGEQFSPAQLFALGEQGAWYDPSDFSTMFQDSAGTTPVTAVGQRVKRILDKSGRGNNATQPGADSIAPILQQDSSGRYFLLFDGTDDFLVTGTITPGTDKAQVFAGVRKLSDAAAGTVVETSSSYTGNAGALAVFAPLSVGTPEFTFGTSGDVANTGYSSLTYAAPYTAVLSGLFDLAGASRPTEVIPRVNGSTPPTLANRGSSSAGGGNYLAYPLYIGRRAGTALPLNGRIYSLIIRFGSVLSVLQVNQTEAWVNGKTGAY